MVMSWEKRIIEAFIERYAASANAKGGKPLKVKVEKLFPHFENALPDEQESFLEAAEQLEKRKLISLVWKRNRKREELLAIIYSASEAIFTSLGQVSPTFRLTRARVAAKRLRLPLFNFIADTIDTFDAVRGMDEQAIEDLMRLIAFIEQNGTELPYTTRSLSISLYTDSKRVEALLSLFNRVLTKALAENVKAPDFSFLARSFPETMIAGRLSFTSGIPNEEGIVNQSGNILGLPLMTIRKMKGIHYLPNKNVKLFKPRALMVENKETFYALATNLTAVECLVYVGGYPNGAVRAFLSLLAAADFTLYHAGDLDIDGIRIFQDVARYAGKPVTPLRMDVATFDEYAHCGRKLEKSMLQNMHLIDPSIRSMAGIEELIARIESSGLGIEQEIIDYTEALRSLA
ncbi:MAG: DUF2220 domain-containing protein [Treponema sp.]|jgi:hypothetical protein|nr:DUF2220 domain-containing protein [Treponema sp.]